MHAAIGVFTHDKSRWEEQKQHLHARIIPMVKQAPGFVAGYWTYEPDTSKTHSFILFGTQADAERFASFVKGDVANRGDHGVTLDAFFVTSVVAEEARDGSP
jgi:hypothetical protein